MSKKWLDAVVFNDTTRYHYGCKQVVDYITKDLLSAGYKVLSYVSSQSVARGLEDVQIASLIDMADLVVINGEGTLHHDAPAAKNLLNVVRIANRKGKQVAVINALWQEMTLDEETIEALKNSYICVREIKSKNELLKSGINADIALDLSYHEGQGEEGFLRSGVVVGGWYGRKPYRPKGAQVIDIFQTSWKDCVKILQNASCLITGRHHEIYAAARARCPFIAFSGNSWKNESLIEMSGADIPTNSWGAPYKPLSYYVDLCSERQKEYDKFFSWMSKQETFKLKEKLK